VTTQELKDKILELSEVQIEGMPHLYGDKPEWSAMVQIKSAADRDEILQKMRFFKWKAN